MKKQRILIIDDEPINITMLAQLLSEKYEILVASSANRGLEIAKEQQPSLILLDIIMPQMDGYEVAKRLKADKATQNIIIAMVSAKKEDHDILTGIDVGAISFITKPFKPFELQEKVEELLQLI